MCCQQPGSFGAFCLVVSIAIPPPQSNDLSCFVQELLDLREALRKKEEEEGSAAYQLKIDLASAQQNETRLKDEVEQLRQRLAQSESEVTPLRPSPYCVLHVAVATQ